jgi:hypothetical protein
MAKGQMRSNREARKPKKDKPKATPSVAPLSSSTPTKPIGAVQTKGGKK